MKTTFTAEEFDYSDKLQLLQRNDPSERGGESGGRSHLAEAREASLEGDFLGCPPEHTEVSPRSAPPPPAGKGPGWGRAGGSRWALSSSIFPADAGAQHRSVALRRISCDQKWVCLEKGW